MIYASRSTFHKKPFGAVRAGEKVTFTLTPPRTLAWAKVYMCVNSEFEGRYTEREMTWRGLNGDCDLYDITLDTEGMLGPVWYWFKYNRADDAEGLYVNPSNLADGEGVVSHGEPRAWQMTVVHNDAEKAPEWFGCGVTYHIFPDRFAKKGVKKTPLEAMPGGRKLHRRWDDCPDFRPDSNGEVRNCDFFGGNIAGVREKLRYIKSLGTNTIYFSPIFEAASNHRYDTASYLRIDPLFGTEEEFKKLCDEAAALGIRILLDGVFNHTGYNSEYFNGASFYNTLGAHQSKSSPYYEWYNFQSWPDRYDSWWGVYTLPQVNESHPSYVDFIIESKDSVIRRWLRAGASGWRLDVADELPDEFIEKLRTAAREEKSDAVIIGEVWEDASNKVAYDVRRQYLLGRELDGVMNYPLRDSLIGYILGGDAADFKNTMETLREHYPRDVYYSLMNALGTHDTPRILTVLGASPENWAQPKEARADCMLTAEQRAVAVKRLMLASAVLFTFPGSPCVFYGDEAGLEGFEDPFNRRCYPWGREDTVLLEWYRRLGDARNSYEALQSGDIRYLGARGGLLAYERVSSGGDRVIVCVNRGGETAGLTIGGVRRAPVDILSGRTFRPKNGELYLNTEPLSVLILV